MTNFGEVLTVLAAGAGLGVLLIMAVVPLLLDRTPHPQRTGARRAGFLDRWT